MRVALRHGQFKFSTLTRLQIGSIALHRLFFVDNRGGEGTSIGLVSGILLADGAQPEEEDEVLQNARSLLE